MQLDKETEKRLQTWADDIKTKVFIEESNRIEGIYRAPEPEEIKAHLRFMELQEVNLDDLVKFVKVYQPDAELRVRTGLNVRVGNHLPPLGSVAIGYALQELLSYANKYREPEHAFVVHQRYEKLHPFTDCNGRSGRILWLWMMQRAPLGFLHHFYYQSLSNWRENA